MAGLLQNLYLIENYSMISAPYLFWCQHHQRAMRVSFHIVGARPHAKKTGQNLTHFNFTR